MSLLTCNRLLVAAADNRRLWGIILAVVICGPLVGCSDNVRPSSLKQLAEFRQAGAARPAGSLVADRLAYRIRPGEALELTMQAILQVTTAEETDQVRAISPYVCRVGRDGAIALPAVGKLEVAGKTLMEIEAAIVDAYYPKYSATRPLVFARLAERSEQLPFTVIGLVNRAGSFPYPPDVELNVMQAIGFAGGLNLDLEPRYAMLYRLKPDGGVANAVLDIADGSDRAGALTTPVRPGDIVAVEHTPRTRTNAFLNRIFRVTIGTYVRLDDLGND